MVPDNVDLEPGSATGTFTIELRYRTSNNFQNGSTGTIDNAIPMTVGGKINCDQITVTCDYFSGDIDYLRIYKG